MPLNYALYPNKTAPTPGLYAARIQPTLRIGLEQLAERIVDMGTTVRKADVLAVLENMCQACENYLVEGARIRIGGIVELYPTIKGNFTGSTDDFDPNRNTIDVGACPGSRVRKNVRSRATVEKLSTVLPSPEVLEYVDTATGLKNSEVTPLNIGTINGNKLKYDDTVGTEGIYFVNASTSAETKVNTVQKNMPGELVFLVPGLATATYYLEVRKHFTPDGDLRTGRLGSTLDVPPVAVTSGNGGNKKKKKRQLVKA